MKILTSKTRRRLLKTSVTVWSLPIITSMSLPAHAQTSDDAFTSGAVVNIPDNNESVPDNSVSSGGAASGSDNRVEQANPDTSNRSMGSE